MADALRQEGRTAESLALLQTSIAALETRIEEHPDLAQLLGYHYHLLANLHRDQGDDAAAREASETARQFEQLRPAPDPR